ncbi:WD40 repeat domain-containing protein [Tengunoibacter tsumagoiensis]|uniref:Uncharacterized protein n=1 Tax=Tengunoibacter tsumagoiensis TaxID=2014871 RepID=A0A402A3J0_9CHLR|nr:WD40 repeat domain-containing protein [Tengunoibacter tsumagoiensis]GCE13717.1 hypothetical protein KTT_35760 [Tengunoibacter tsumagoiensis]
MSDRWLLIVTDDIRNAFEKIYGSANNKTNDEQYEAFASRWGGLSLSTFQRVLQEDEGDDRLCAMFMLADNFSPTILDPFLTSQCASERLISAIILGTRKDARAYPYLEALLLEGLSLEERSQAQQSQQKEPLKRIRYADRFRSRIVKLLAGWESPTLGERLVELLQALWQVETSALPVYSDDELYGTIWYALGQHGMFGALEKIDLPQPLYYIAQVYLALGHQNAQADPTFIRTILRNPAVEHTIRCFLTDHFQYGEEEQQLCLQAFQQEQAHFLQYRKQKESSTDNAKGSLSSGLAFQSTSVQSTTDQSTKDQLPPEKVIQVKRSYQCVYKGHFFPILSLSWSPDSQRLASGGADATVRIWDSWTGSTRTVFREHSGSVTAVAWSPRASLVASSGGDQRILVWEAESGALVTSYEQHTSLIAHALAWSPNGELIASGSWDGSVHIWEARTGKTHFIYRGHQGIVTALAWSPDGKKIVSGGGYPECAVHVWNSTTGRHSVNYAAHRADGKKKRNQSIRELESEEWQRGPSSVRSLVWSPNGSTIASAGLSSVLRVWNARNGKEVASGILDYADGPLAWSRDSRALLIANNTSVDVWSLAQGRIVQNYVLPGLAKIYALACAPDNQLLAAGDQRGLVSVWLR